MNDVHVFGTSRSFSSGRRRPGAQAKLFRCGQRRSRVVTAHHFIRCAAFGEPHCDRLIVARQDTLEPVGPILCQPLLPVAFLQYREFLGRCADFEAEIAKERATNKFTYAELEEEDTDLKKLQSWLDKIRKLDFYGATLAEEAAARLRGCEELLDAYARQVFDAHDENR